MKVLTLMRCPGYCPLGGQRINHVENLPVLQSKHCQPHGLAYFGVDVFFHHLELV